MQYKLNKKSDGPLYLTEQDEIKENSNCPDSEKNGSGPGSCGGSTGKPRDKDRTAQTTKIGTINSIKSFYQTAEKDEKDFSELKSDLTKSMSVSSFDYSPEEAKSVIATVDKLISSTQKDLDKTEKYYKEKLQSDDRDVGMNIFHMKQKIAILKAINADNRKKVK